MLPVPFISQTGPGADRSHNDCGVACVAMLIQAYTGKKVSVDELYASVSSGTDRYLRASELITLLANYGIESVWIGMTIKDLFLCIFMGKPVIALIQYAPIRDAGLAISKFGGPHFVVVIGLDQEHVYINDPLNNPAKMPLAVPIDIWSAAWQGAGVDGNPANHVVSPAKPLPLLVQGDAVITRVYVIADPFLNVRCGPGIAFAVVRQAYLNDTVPVFETHEGWTRIGESEWCFSRWLSPVAET